MRADPFLMGGAFAPKRGKFGKVWRRSGGGGGSHFLSRFEAFCFGISAGVRTGALRGGRRGGSGRVGPPIGGADREVAPGLGSETSGKQCLGSKVNGDQEKPVRDFERSGPPVSSGITGVQNCRRYRVPVASTQPREPLARFRSISRRHAPRSPTLSPGLRCAFAPRFSCRYQSALGYNTSRRRGFFFFFAARDR